MTGELTFRVARCDSIHSVSSDSLMLIAPSASYVVLANVAVHCIGETERFPRTLRAQVFRRCGGLVGPRFRAAQKRSVTTRTILVMTLCSPHSRLMRSCATTSRRGIFSDTSQRTKCTAPDGEKTTSKYTARREFQTLVRQDRPLRT